MSGGLLDPQEGVSSEDPTACSQSRVCRMHSLELRRLEGREASGGGAGAGVRSGLWWILHGLPHFTLRTTLHQEFLFLCPPEVRHAQATRCEAGIPGRTWPLGEGLRKGPEACWTPREAEGLSVGAGILLGDQEAALWGRQG